MMIKSREIELKLEMDGESSGLLLRHPLLEAASAKTVDQHAVYFDTPTRTLREAGFSLRVRKSGARHVQTVKQSGSGSAGLFDRPEWESEVAGFAVDYAAAAATPLARHLTAKVRRKLVPLVESKVRRTSWLLKPEGGEAEIEMILDQGRISGGACERRVEEVEIELIRGEPDRLFELADALAGQVPLRLGVLSKAERGYALVDGVLDQVAKAERIALRAEMSVAEGFAAIAYSCLRHFRLNEPLVTARRDPGALHQARVAMRRLRSAFTLFRPAIAGEGFERLREELRWFTGQLGDARNLDVLLKRFAGTENKAQRMLIARLEAARAAAYDQVIAALETQRLRALMLDLVRWIETGGWRTRRRAEAPLAGFAVEQLDRRWRTVKKTGRHLAALEAEPRHRLRINVKKLRYAVEFLSGLQGGETAARQKTFVTALADIQEQLGELNDAETARELIAGLRLKADDAAAITARLTQQGCSEKQCLAAAEAGYAKLVEAGPYWR